MGTGFCEAEKEVVATYALYKLSDGNPVRFLGEYKTLEQAEYHARTWRKAGHDTGILAPDGEWEHRR